MTVRWKPLLILSGLFVVVALMGLMTIATVMGSRGTAEILARARLEVKAKEYEKAKLDFQRALKLEPQNAAIHEEMANLFEQWAREAAPERKSELRGQYLASLGASARTGTKRVEPRRRLLVEAIRLDDVLEQVRWAKELATLDPTNRDAQYVLATEELEGPSPNIPEDPPPTGHPRGRDAPGGLGRTGSRPGLASLANDKPRLEVILKKARSVTLPADSDPVDRMALLRLDALDVVTTTDAKNLAAPIEAVAREALAASAEPEIPSTRIARISMMIEEVQRTLIRRGQESPPKPRNSTRFTPRSSTRSRIRSSRSRWK